MDIADFIPSEAVFTHLRVSSKKEALQVLAERAADLTGQSRHAIFDVLFQRERLGTTGIGDGIAIPHGRLPNLTRLFGLLAHLDSPIEFDAVDDRPVDLIFVLLAPESAGGDHLTALARMSRLLRDRQVCERLRKSRNGGEVLAVLGGNASAAKVTQ